MSATKFDSAKARFDLIPPAPLEELAKLYALGAAKYGEGNWMGGMEWGRPYAALLRHVMAWWKGEKYDTEDKQHHLIAVAWNAFTLYEFERRKIGTDNRTFIEKE